MTVTQIESIVSLEYPGKLTYKAIKLQEQAQLSLFFLISYFYYTKKLAHLSKQKSQPQADSLFYSIKCQARFGIEV